ncbi:hypothetical protein I656_03071 [Geobacillus sp. WSUCF1]|nr:hypothetical protein I656_03071 [Geobacillus sp. WSUCF1]
MIIFSYLPYSHSVLSYLINREDGNDGILASFARSPL